MTTKQRTKRDPLIILTAFLIGIGTLFFMPVPEANAATPGCLGQVRDQESLWAQRDVVAQPAVGAGVHMVGKDVTMVVQTRYTYCRSKYRSVRPKGGIACYRLEDGVNHHVFDGVKIDPYYYDDNENVNPGPFTIPDNGKASNCVNFKIPKSMRENLEEDQDARWNVWSQIKRNGTFGFMDHGAINWNFGGQSIMYFRPATDNILRNWHW